MWLGTESHANPDFVRPQRYVIGDDTEYVSGDEEKCNCCEGAKRRQEKAWSSEVVLFKQRCMVPVSPTAISGSRSENALCISLMSSEMAPVVRIMRLCGPAPVSVAGR